MRKLISALTVPAGLALLVVPVQAQVAPSSPGLSVSRSTTSPGQRVTVAKDGASPGAIVTITLDRSPSSAATALRPAVAAPARLTLGRAVAADDGSFRHSVTIPPETAPGVYALGATTNGRQLGQAALQVAARGAAVTALPFTGPGIMPGLLAGAGLIVAGGLLLLGIRYQRSSA